MTSFANKYVDSSPYGLLSVLLCVSFALIGCDQSQASINAVSTIGMISPSQPSVRAGNTVSLSANEAGGAPLAGGRWIVVGGSTFGSVDIGGTYHAPAAIPSTGLAVVQYLLKNLSLTTTISLLNPIPSIASVTPRALIAESTPVTVTGDNFVNGSQIVINGHPILTTFVDARHLTGNVILASASSGPTQIMVSNPAPGAALSSGVGIAISAPLAPPPLPLATQHTPSYFMEQSDEFVGPFPSWTNVKTAFGAVGDGIVDDTAAIQRAINSITVDSASCVLWLPAGTYKITSTLVFGHMQDFSFIGEDPATTTLKWAGAQGGTMVLADGSSWFKLSRLGFDGSGTANIAEDLNAITTYQNPLYSTFNELSDQHIRGVNIGIQLKIAAETTIERVFFDQLQIAGITVGDFNTLDIFVNDSLFVGCGTGLTDAYNNGAGSFIVSNSYFKSSQVADMSIANTGLFTARHNTSVGSKTFFLAYELYNNSSSVTLQNNTILDPITTPFQFGNLGPFMLIDNVVRLQDSTIPMIEASWTPTGLLKDVFSMGNVYTPNGGQGTGNLPFEGRLISYDDTIVPLATIADVLVPSNVYVPPNHHRLIFEVGARTGVSVQSAINLAASSNTPRPVVHLVKGTYPVSSTITLPAESDVQLIGDDSWLTNLVWSGVATSPVISIANSNVSVRNLRIEGGGQGTNDGILLSIADEPNTQLIMDQNSLAFWNSYSVNFDKMEHATIEMFSTYTTGSITGVRATGGSFRAANEGTLGVTNHYTGSLQSVATSTSFDVSAGGKYMVQDTWHDYGITGPQNFKLSGTGTVTQQGGVVFMNSAAPFEIDNFTGNVSLIGVLFTGGFKLASTAGQANLLNLGLVGDSATYLPSSSNNISVGNVLNSYRGNHITQNAIPDVAWMRNMLAQTRSEYPIARPTLATGANRIRLNRILVDSTSSAIHVTPDAAKVGLYYVIASGLANLVNTTGVCVSTTFSNTNDQWLLMAAGEGDFEIISKKTNTALGFASSPSQTLSLEPITGRYDQRWIISKLGDGNYSILNRQTGTLLSLPVQGGCAGISSGGSTSWTITVF